MPFSEPIAVLKGTGLGAAYEACLAEQDSMCRALEELADSLPERLDTWHAVVLVGHLRALLERAHSLEETWVFPRLVTTSAEMLADRLLLLARLRAEHAENEDYAVELEEALAGFWVRPVARADAERLGYLLRGLFVSLRRHVAQDRDLVRPLLRTAEAE